MVGHAAQAHETEAAGKLKRHDYFQRMGNVVAEIIKQGVTEPCSGDDADHPPDEVVLKKLCCQLNFFSFNPVGKKQIDHRKGDQIHQAVVTKLERADAKERWADA